MTATAIAPRPAQRPAERPAERPARRPAPRLTRRGWLAAALVAFALLGGAFRMGAATAGERYVPTRPVVVTAGDSLWSIAADSAGPGQDIQALVVRLARINHLSGSHLEVGDVLEVPLE